MRRQKNSRFVGGHFSKLHQGGCPFDFYHTTIASHLQQLLTQATQRIERAEAAGNPALAEQHRAIKAAIEERLARGGGR